MLALPTPVTIPENGHFVLISPDQPGDVFLMSKDNQQGDGNGKSAVQGLVCIKNIEDENRECQAGKNGTQGNESGQIKYKEKNSYATNSRKRLDGDYHSKKSRYPFSAPEFRPDGENVTGNGCKAQANHKICPFSLIVQVIWHQDKKTSGDYTFENIRGHDKSTPAGTQDPKSIGSTRIATTVLADVYSEERSAYP
jgi:hypothetical protein